MSVWHKRSVIKTSQVETIASIVNDLNALLRMNFDDSGDKRCTVRQLNPHETVIGIISKVSFFYCKPRDCLGCYIAMTNTYHCLQC